MFRISLIAIAIVLITVFKTSQSCSCLPNPPDQTESFEEAQAVFVGKAVRVVDNPETQQRRIVFKARRVFKSFKCPKKQFIIFTAMNSAMCGVGIQLGEVWQIWAYGTPDRLTTYLCSRSTTDLSANRSFLRTKTCS